MNRKFSLTVLIIVSAVIIITLSYIQYVLVHNTYELTKDKYYTEVKKRMNEVVNLPEIDSMVSKAQENLKQTATKFRDRKLSRKESIREFYHKNNELQRQFNASLLKIIKRNRALDNVKYKYQYEEVIMQSRKKTDTLLSHKDLPVVAFGNPFHSINTLLIRHDEAVSIINTNIKGSKVNFNDTFKLIVRSSNYIDVSGWKKTVFNRMLNTFLLGAGLIIAVISVFFLIFRALIIQKRIAEIKTDFANNITHELKTPLTSVGIILKSISRDQIRGEKHQMDGLIQSLERQHQKIQQIVDDVLESAMLTDITIEMEVLNMTKFIEHYGSDLKLPSHNLIVQIGSGDRTLFTNSTIIEKILNALIENAQKYSPKDGNIKLQSYTEDNFLFIAVSDNGPGIAEEYQKYIFEKFYRLPEQNKHSVKGLGLGLFLARQAATKIGATLLLRSTPGNGSTFLIRFPI